MTDVALKSPVLTVDVAILGGGVQGLWLLTELIDAGYQAILLERKQLGFGQTGHSHVFLHEGHIYASMVNQSLEATIPRVAALLRANSIWKSALEKGRLQHLKPMRSNFYIGWDNPGKGDTFAARCALTSLPYDEVKDPAEFAGIAKMSRLFKSEGVCLESSALLNQLLEFRGVKQWVSSCEKVQTQPNESGNFDLVVSHSPDLISDNKPAPSIVIRPGAIMLSAGAGNESLIQDLFDPLVSADSEPTRQQTVKTFMLVLRHMKSSPPAVSGMFPDRGGLFMVSRQDAEGRTIWLIGDKQREVVSVPGEMTNFDAITWFRTFEKSLQQVFPEVVADATNYEWGIYEATKAERRTTTKFFSGGGAFPEGYHIHKHPKLPIWLVWPTLLTFAPLVANSIVEEIGKQIRPARPANDLSLWKDFHFNPPVFDCRWKKTPLQSWQKFIEYYSVPPRDHATGLTLLPIERGAGGEGL